MMEIRLAEHCGFCFGVKRAVTLASDALEKYGRVAVMGDLVHNKKVMEKLRKRGLVYVRDLEEAAGMPLLLQAHGTAPLLIEKARKMGLKVIDATCPLVSEIHRSALELESEGRQVIVIGDRDHDEVRGIVSRLHDACVISHAPDIGEHCDIKPKCGVVIQSTQQFENVREILPILLTKSHDCRIINTICEPTRRNQKEVRELAKSNDCVLVIGDAASANSTRLFTLLQSMNPNSYRISGVEEIDSNWFRGCKTLGITAGASTPDELIDEVLQYVKSLDGDKKK
ncbi:MAG: 4-hydroxy-3-methylbut-2-enyl diphosphate reductase [Candidatus Neomarinimicrobiota bacterium]|nr:4-hydroxy-3-methylbut-2-enyl diphosphate reductase [Candidatus Neomarinimicrobiota bacterium]MDD3966430.1 4-hydroxy-3-methylbut-2-enyl diphosphate reductase [Candidatus Neomarinimicrobiota bacterium]MDX9779802.1 4-hydroxy-3-methylbut-2-enyl diphosphate reductase [bacterium]